MEVNIQAQHIEVHPRWRELIQRRADKLKDFCSEIVRLHVTLVHSQHHSRGDEEVRLLASVPHETFKVHKSMADMGDAIQAAFGALEHDLHAFIERRRDLHRRTK